MELSVSTDKNYNTKELAESFWDKQPFEGYMIDFLVIAIVLVSDIWLQPLLKHYAVFICWILGPMQILLMLFLCGKKGTFLATPTRGDHECVRSFRLRREVTKKLGFMHYVLVAMSFASFLWIMVVPSSILPLEYENVIDLTRFNIIIAILGGVFIAAFGNTYGKSIKKRRFRVLYMLVASSYIILTESVLLLMHSTTQTPTWLIFVCLILAYLPIRYLMLTKPPVVKTEFITAIAAMLFFLANIV